MKKDIFIEIRQMSRRGFTLIELLTVIAIIGILAGVVLVSSQSATVKAKRAAALTTASSVLPELVICQDDGGHSKNSAPAADDLICCKFANACSNVSGNIVSGHTATWSDVYAKTGWQYSSSTNDAYNGTYIFTLTKGTETPITCDMVKNGCE